MAGWRPLVLGLALCAVSGVVARAHIVYGTRTLQQLVAESDLVLRARIVSLADRLSLGPEPTGADRPSVEAEVLDVLKGDLKAPKVTFVQHGHGVARFESGQEALIFLNRIGRSRELDALAAGGGVAWVSFQEHDETYALTSANRKPLLPKGAGEIIMSHFGLPPSPIIGTLKVALEKAITEGRLPPDRPVEEYLGFLQDLIRNSSS